MPALTTIDTTHANNFVEPDMTVADAVAALASTPPQNINDIALLETEFIAPVATAAAAGKKAAVEPFLQENQHRFVMFPIQYDDIWELYKKQVDSFWRPEEIDLSKDLNDWAGLDADEKYFISMILAFFAASDGIVMENLAQRFYNDVPVPEVRAFYSFQIAMEGIHSETYSLLIETYIKDKEEKLKLFHSLDHFEFIKKKADWAMKYINDTRSSFHVRLIAFLCVEGIFFSGAFSAIFWLKKRGLMPGLTFSNELISRDEALHAEAAILFYGKLQKKLPKKKVHEIVREACEIEKEFMTSALPCRLIGMNSDLMCQYIEFVSDRICLQLGYDEIYKSANPFDFMERISLQTKSNFFERTVSEYVLANTKKEDDIFDFNADF
jgi:ribonucleoside-diphosphate reductase subunit M2